MGNKLFHTVVEATGLPTDPVNCELAKLLQKQGVSPDTMTLDDLREVLADYLQDTLLEAKENYGR